MKEENNHNNKVELEKKKKGGAAAAGHRNRFVLVPILFHFFFARARFQSVGRGIFVPFWLCFVFLSQLSIDIYFSSCFFYFVILK